MNTQLTICPLPDQDPNLKWAAETRQRIEQLRRWVFIHDDSERDEQRLKRCIYEYLYGRREETLTKSVWYEVWELNEKGLFGKYTFFNDKNHNVHLENRFFEWAKLTCELMSYELARAFNRY